MVFSGLFLEFFSRRMLCFEYVALGSVSWVFFPYVFSRVFSPPSFALVFGGLLGLLGDTFSPPAGVQTWIPPLCDFLGPTFFLSGTHILLQRGCSVGSHPCVTFLGTAGTVWG